MALEIIQGGLTAAASSSGEETATPLSATANAGTGNPSHMRDRLDASSSVRQLRQVLQQLGVDSSGCLEKEEPVERVRQPAAADGPAAAGFALPQTLLPEGPEPGASNPQAPGSVTQQPSAAGDSRLQDGAAGRQQGAAAGDTPAAAMAATQAAGGVGDSSRQPPERRCARCGASPSEGVQLRRCPCGLVRYCGERCQGEDWAGHKAACREARRRQQ
jgi:peptidoglycan hydrolase-like protein with peptidoglycan-binding domain